MSIIRQVKTVAAVQEEKPEENSRKYEFLDFNNKKTSLIKGVQDDRILIKNLEKYENCAYNVVSHAGHFYFLKSEGSYLFDPTKDSPSYKKRLWKWKKVSKKAYEVYEKFIQEKKTRLLSVVEKLI